MNIKQKTIVWIGATIFTLMCAFPPWSSSISLRGVHVEVFKKYSFFLIRPESSSISESDQNKVGNMLVKASMKIDYKRLTLQILVLIVLVIAALSTSKENEHPDNGKGKILVEAISIPEDGQG